MSLVLRDIRFGYGPALVLDGVSMSVAAGEIVCLFGPSGCGKTTALRVAAGLERLTGGNVELDGKTLSSRQAHVAPEDREIGFVFQDYVLFQHMTVAENVAFGLNGLSGKERRVRIEAELAGVGLSDLANRRPAELSGGQQQRAALARAFARRPRAMLLDEPFASIDAALRRRLRAELRRMLKERGTPAIVVTHDVEEAVELGDRIAIMARGRILEDASPEKLWTAAATPQGALVFAGAQRLAVTPAADGVSTPFGPIAVGPRAEAALAVILPGGASASADEAGRARVVDCRFAGPDFLATLEAIDHPGLLLRATSIEALPAGARARVTFEPGRARMINGQADDA
ncbi:MAG: ABC transporter ATP-binding protein [Parvularculaceae bacterium]